MRLPASHPFCAGILCDVSCSQTLQALAAPTNVLAFTALSPGGTSHDEWCRAAAAGTTYLPSGMQSGVRVTWVAPLGVSSQICGDAAYGPPVGTDLLRCGARPLLGTYHNVDTAGNCFLSRPLLGTAHDGLRWGCSSRRVFSWQSQSRGCACWHGMAWHGMALSAMHLDSGIWHLASGFWMLLGQNRPDWCRYFVYQALIPSSTHIISLCACLPNPSSSLNCACLPVVPTP